MIVLAGALLQMAKDVGLMRNEVSSGLSRGRRLHLGQAEEDRVFYKVESLRAGPFITWLSNLIGMPLNHRC